MGLLTEEEAPARRSGRAAWSPRLQPRMVEMSFAAASAAASSSSLYHRIRYFKRNGAVVWEAASAASFSAGSPAAGGGGFLSSLGGVGGAQLQQHALALLGSPAGAQTPGTPPLPPSVRRAHQRSSGSRDDLFFSAALLAPPGQARVEVCISVLPVAPSRPPRRGDGRGAGGGEDASPPACPTGPLVRVSLTVVPCEGERAARSPSPPNCCGSPAAEGTLAVPGGQGEADGEGEDAEGLWLPDAVWAAVLLHLRPRDLCALARVSRQLRRLATAEEPWAAAHRRIFGRHPGLGLAAGAVRRTCRSSELRAAGWAEAALVPERGEEIGPPSGACLALDESKAVSADGPVVRLWSPATGRKIAALRGHAEQVECLAFDAAHVLSGDAAGGLRLWSIDDLKCTRAHSRAHPGGAAACQLLNGLPLSAGADGRVRIWDAALANSVAELPAGGPLRALAGEAGRLLAGGVSGLCVFDMATAGLLGVLPPPDSAGSCGGGALAVDAVHACGPLAAVARGPAVELWDLRTAGSLLASEGSPPLSEGGGQRLRPVLVLDLTRRGGGGGRTSPIAHPCQRSTMAGGLPGDGGRGSGPLDDDDGLGENLLLLSGDDWAPSTSGGALWAEPPPAAAAAGVQLDGWKLVCADGGLVGGGLRAFDLRALPAAMDGFGAARAEPLWRRKAGAPVTSFKFHGSTLLVGRSNGPFVRWEMDGGAARRQREADDGGDAEAAAWTWQRASSSPSAAEDAGARRRNRGARFPKRAGGSNSGRR